MDTAGTDSTAGRQGRTRTCATGPRASLLRCCARLRHDQAGQSLVVMIISILALFAMAAFAIDIAQWYQKHHQAQVAADSAALAAANCMAYSGSVTGTYTNTCTTSGDTGDATKVATTYASANGVAIPASDVSFNSTTSPSVVTVTTPNTAPAFFAGLFGIHHSVQTANAAANWTQQQVTGYCSTTATDCYAAFAYNDTCDPTGQTSPPNVLGLFNNGNSLNVTGAAHSNGSLINTGNVHAVFHGPSTYGGPNQCSESGVSGATANANILPYPADYSGRSATVDDASPPACTYTATSTGDTPAASSWPSDATPNGNNITYNGGSTSAVYCAPNGTITIAGGGPAAPGDGTGGVTFIANTIVITANNILLQAYHYKIAGNHLLFWQTAETSTTENWNGSSCLLGTSSVMDIGSGGTGPWKGDVFAPCSTVYFTNNNLVWSPTFFEAWNVSLAGNNFVGDGPSASGTGNITVPGQDNLVQ